MFSLYSIFWSDPMAEDVIDSTENMKLTADDVEIIAISDEGWKLLKVVTSHW